MKRKVRKDFDATNEYSVNVSGCTQNEKKEVQQAFFDVGILWKGSGAKYGHLSALQYTNLYEYGGVPGHYLYEGVVKSCNMTAKEFLDLVYEPEQQGHIHAELMAQYAEDAKTHDEPWELWQVKGDDGVWKDCQRKGSVDGWQHCSHHPAWWCATEYRRKPKIHFVHGVEIPDLRVRPKYDEYYYLVNPLSEDLFTRYSCTGNGSEDLWVERGLTYQSTEEGKQAAILHSKAMLGND